MPNTPNILLCRYHYDPLDRLAGREVAGQASGRSFYQKNRLTTEIQGQERRSWLQTPQQLLAQRRCTADISETALIATDIQGSVLHGLDASQPQAYAYSVYGNRHPALDPLHLPGFNREQADPVTGHYLLGNGYRAFNPVLMRFNNPDSLSPFGRGGLNAYGYCTGDPVNGVDPGGNVPKPSLLLGRRWSMGDTDIFRPRANLPRRASTQMLEDMTPYQKSVLETTEADALQSIASYLYGKPETSIQREIHGMTDAQVNAVLRGERAREIGPALWLSRREDLRASGNENHRFYGVDPEVLRRHRAQFSRRSDSEQVTYALSMRNADLGQGFPKLMEEVRHGVQAGVSIALKYATRNFRLNDFLGEAGFLPRRTRTA